MSPLMRLGRAAPGLSPGWGPGARDPVRGVPGPWGQPTCVENIPPVGPCLSPPWAFFSAFARPSSVMD